MTKNNGVPHEPRQLTPRELSSLDVYSYVSPKNERVATLVGWPAFAQAIIYEFDTNIDCWMERPRILEMNDGKTEINFWVRYKDSCEEYVLLVLQEDTEPAANGGRRHRLFSKLSEAATNSALRLSFVFEAELTKRAIETMNATRMLAYAQIARDLPNRGVLRNAIDHTMKSAEAARLSDICDAFPGYTHGEVYAVVIDLIQDGRLTFDRQTAISSRMIVLRACT